jgi:hypothetical protein
MYSIVGFPYCVFLGTRSSQVSYWVKFLSWAQLFLVVTETQFGTLPVALPASFITFLLAISRGPLGTDG